MKNQHQIANVIKILLTCLEEPNKKFVMKKSKKDSLKKTKKPLVFKMKTIS